MKVIYINSIQAVGLWRSYSVLTPNTWPQGVIFSALLLAKFIGCSPIYIVGINNSLYLNHYHNQFGIIKFNLENAHAYVDELNDPFANQVIPYLTRNMSDVLYAHAVFLNDLRRFATKVNVINVGQSDFTNDAFYFGCLLK